MSRNSYLIHAIACFAIAFACFLLIGCAALSRQQYTCLDRAIELCVRYEAEGYQTRIGVGYPDDLLPWEYRETHAIVEHKERGKDWKRHSIGHRVPVVLEWMSWQEAKERWR